MQRISVTLNINGEERHASVPVHKTLLEVLREDLNLTGTKHGCELGECGACTVLVDGHPVLSCLALPVELQGKDITTIEGVGTAAQPHPLQEEWVNAAGSQCGYCSPGFVLSAKALLEENPRPTLDEIRQALAGHICRCTGYIKIFESVERAAKRMHEAEVKS